MKIIYESDESGCITGYKIIMPVIIILLTISAYLRTPIVAISYFGEGIWSSIGE
jgi:hypothetical protein